MRITLREIHKSFGHNEVLKGIDLTVHPGEILAVVGENGAGKSTLTRIISGAHRATRGTVEIDGSAVEFHKPQDAIKAGIQVIYQEFGQNLFPELTAAENLFAGDRSGRHGRVFIDRAQMVEDAGALLRDVGMSTDPRTLVRNLTVSEQQMLTIGKAIGENAKVLILDEPTAALDQGESEALFEQVRRLRDEGVAIVYISHRLAEVFDLADRLMVLRDGKVALETTPQASSERDVVTAMVGRSLGNFYPKERHGTERTVLELQGLGSSGHFVDVNLKVHAGEVVGVGGVQGCGKGELLRSLFGLTPISAGKVLLNGKTIVPTTPARAIHEGVSYITPDRQAEGLAPQQSISRNMSMSTFGEITTAGFVRMGEQNARAERMRQSLNVRATGIHQEVGSLSGGNQQKVLFARWLIAEPQVLLMEEPTRGVDVGAKTEIYRIINEQAALGVAIVLVSSDLMEIVEMSDRVVVMRQGRIVANLTGTEQTQESVLNHALESAAS